MHRSLFPRTLLVAALTLLAPLGTHGLDVARGTTPDEDVFNPSGSGYRLYEVSGATAATLRFEVVQDTGEFFSPLVVLFRSSTGAWSILSTRFYTPEGWISLEGPGKVYAGAGGATAESPAVSDSGWSNPFIGRDLALPAAAGHVLVMWANHDGSTWVRLAWNGTTHSVAMTAAGSASPFRTSDLDSGAEAGVARVARLHLGSALSRQASTAEAPVAFLEYQTDDLVSRGHLTVRADSLSETVDLDRTPDPADTCTCGSLGHVAAGASSSLAIELEYAGTARTMQAHGIVAMLPASAMTPSASILHQVRF